VVRREGRFPRGEKSRNRDEIRLGVYIAASIGYSMEGTFLEFTMNIPASIAPGWFPQAIGAEHQARPFPCGVCEAPSPPPAPFSERHLQCVWADDRLRPAALATAAGERVQVEHPGEWNTGPGPDFLNAALLVGPELRRITGDVEIHIRPADWQRHHHAGDSRYRRVCAHVSFYPGTLPAAELPPAPSRSRCAPPSMPAPISRSTTSTSWPTPSPRAPPRPPAVPP
jgi:hypothetical protein